MKLYLLVLFVFLTFSLNVKHEKEKHQEPITIGIVIGAIGAAIALTKYLEGKFVVTCGNGYKRGVNVNLFNRLNRQIRSLGHYQDSGKVFSFGEQTIKPNQFSKYYFVKHAGSATGACGVTAWRLSDRDLLVIFYENPWSSWNFQGACIYQNVNLPSNTQQQLPRSTLENYYDLLYRQHRRWPWNCIELDNTRTKDENWIDKSQRPVGPYFLEVVAKYEYVDDAGPNDCYTSEITVAVK